MSRVYLVRGPAGPRWAIDVVQLGQGEQVVAWRDYPTRDQALLAVVEVRAWMQALAGSRVSEAA
jgi:hypothetical protein